VRANASIASKLAGGWLAMFGLAGDLAAGYLVATQRPLLGMLVHVPSVAIWALGIQAIAPGTSTGDARQGVWAKSLGGWAIVSAVLGWLLFPGIGTASISFAFLLSYLFRRRRVPHLTLGETLASMQIPALDVRASLWQASQIVPLVDALRQERTEIRQVVVRTLGDQGDQNSVKTLRRLLGDANPDVRGDAAVILTRLENDYQQRILNAMQQVERDPGDLEERLHLARLYYQFADSGLLDQVSSQYYLEKACHIFQREASAHPGRIDVSIDLARVFSHLGRPHETIKILLGVLQREHDNPAATRLLLEVAFAEQEWGIFLSVAQDARALDPEQEELLRWWIEIIPPSWKGALHG
jgi:hypothetical protein